MLRSVVPVSLVPAPEMMVDCSSDYIHLLGVIPRGDRFTLPTAFQFQSCEPAIRGCWSSTEDNLLSAAVTRYGCNQWDAVAAQIPGRNATQCRERWMFRIGPGLNKTPFQAWEDDLIVDSRRSLGNHWTAIANRLPGRTSCAVKNRWYSVLRKRKEQEHVPPRSDEAAYSISALLVK
jgi:hypothetical protein